MSHLPPSLDPPLESWQLLFTWSGQKETNRAIQSTDGKNDHRKLYFVMIGMVLKEPEVFEILKNMMLTMNFHI